MVLFLILSVTYIAYHAFCKYNQEQKILLNKQEETDNLLLKKIKNCFNNGEPLHFKLIGSTSVNDWLFHCQVVELTTTHITVMYDIQSTSQTAKRERIFKLSSITDVCNDPAIVDSSEKGKEQYAKKMNKLL